MNDMHKPHHTLANETRITGVSNTMLFSVTQAEERSVLQLPSVIVAQQYVRGSDRGKDSDRRVETRAEESTLEAGEV